MSAQDEEDARIDSAAANAHWCSLCDCPVGRGWCAGCIAVASSDNDWDDDDWPDDW